ncbi:MAG: hypothetical protein ACT6QR_15470, partial [Microbacterium aurantiacum]
MTVGEGRIIFDEAGRHREVSRDLVGVLLAQRLQFVPRRTVEVPRGDLLGDRRIVVPRAILACCAVTGAPVRPVRASSHGTRTVSTRRPATPATAVSRAVIGSALGHVDSSKVTLFLCPHGVWLRVGVVNAKGPPNIGWPFRLK